MREPMCPERERKRLDIAHLLKSSHRARETPSPLERKLGKDEYCLSIYQSADDENKKL